MNTSLISVIIPIYNVEKYLCKCIDSVLAQTYTNLEIILVDDGSTDTSGQICDQYADKDARIKVIHKANGGVSSARNAGLEIAGGEYIGFVDADDYIEPDMYAYLYQLCQAYHTKISICNYTRVINGKTIPQKPHFPQTVLQFQQHCDILCLEAFAVTKLFHKSTIAQKRFPEDISVAEDMVFCLSILHDAQNIVYGPLCKYHYVQNLQSATKQAFNPKKLTYFKAAKYALSYAKEHNLPQLTKCMQNQICYHAVGFLRQIANSNFKEVVIISSLQDKIRSRIWQYLWSRYKLNNKLFALACCINFNITRYMYQLIQGKLK